MSEQVPIQSLVSQTLLDVLAYQEAEMSSDKNSESKGLAATVLSFSNSRLAIENPIVIRSGQRGSLQDFIGAVVAGAFSTDTELCIVFNGGDEISISLRASDFTGPEAAVYAPYDGPMVVFN